MFENNTKMGGSSFTKQCLAVGNSLSDVSDQINDNLTKILEVEEADALTLRQAIDDSTEMVIDKSANSTDMAVSIYKDTTGGVRQLIATKTDTVNNWLNGAASITYTTSSPQEISVSEVLTRLEESGQFYDVVTKVNALFTTHTSVNMSTIANTIGYDPYQSDTMLQLRNMLSQICDERGVITQAAWITALKSMLTAGSDAADKVKYKLDTSKPFFFQTIMDVVWEVLGQIAETVFSLLALMFKGIGALLYFVYQGFKLALSKVTNTTEGTFSDIDDPLSTSLYVSAPTIGVSFRNTLYNASTGAYEARAVDIPLLTSAASTNYFLKDQGLLQATYPGSEVFCWTNDTDTCYFQQYLCANVSPERFIAWLCTDPLNNSSTLTGWHLKVEPVDMSHTGTAWNNPVGAICLCFSAVDDVSKTLSQYTTLGDLFAAAPDSVYLTPEERMELTYDHVKALKCICFAHDLVALSSLQMRQPKQMRGGASGYVYERGIEMVVGSVSDINAALSEFASYTEATFWNSDRVKAICYAWNRFAVSLYHEYHYGKLSATYDVGKYPSTSLVNVYGSHATTNPAIDGEWWKKFFDHVAMVGNEYTGTLNSSSSNSLLSVLTLNHEATTDAYTFNSKKYGMSFNLKNLLYSYCSLQAYYGSDGPGLSGKYRTVCRPRRWADTRSSTDFYSETATKFPYAVPDKVTPEYPTIPSDRFWTPPTMSATLLMATAIVVASVVVAAVFFKTKIARYFQKRSAKVQAKRLSTLNKKREAYLAHPGDTAIANDYANAVWKYNRTAKFLHWGSYDSANGWMNAPSSSALSAGATPLLDSISQFSDSEIYKDIKNSSMGVEAQRLLGFNASPADDALWPSILSIQKSISG